MQNRDQIQTDRPTEIGRIPASPHRDPRTDPPRGIDGGAGVAAQQTTTPSGYVVPPRERHPEPRTAFSRTSESGRSSARNSRSSKTERIIIVGGGPGGLVLAALLRALGYEVLVLESSPSYGSELHVVDDRSFNLTIDGLGMHAAGPLSRLIYATGLLIDGRAIHRPSKPMLTHPYGHAASDHFVAVSRTDLLVALTQHLCVDWDCPVRFGCKVTSADAKTGELNWHDTTTGENHQGFADLIVFADGVGGLGREKAFKKAGVSAKKESDPTAYLKAEIKPDAAKQCGIPLDKINFWPGEGGVSIGVPNVNGSVSVLVMGELPGAFESPVFTNPTDAMRFMRSRNPLLLDAIPDLGNQLVNRKSGNFATTEVSTWRLGPRAVLLGDAGRCAPPWAGLGANSALSDADALVTALTEHRDLDEALVTYSAGRVAASAIIQRLIVGHGRLLNVSLGSWPWRLLHGIQDLRERMFDTRTLYQRIAFDKGGLDREIRESHN